MRHRVPLLLRLALLPLLLSFGCPPEDDPTGGTPPPGGGGELVGDWFFCLDPECTVLDRKGSRYGSDGTFTTLYAPGEGWSPPGEYCVTEPTQGSYELSDGRLVLSYDDGRTYGSEVSVTGDRMTVVPDSEPALEMLRLGPPASVGACTE